MHQKSLNSPQGSLGFFRLAASACLAIGAFFLASPSASADPIPFQTIDCEGEYKHHLQGVCADDKGHIFWSFTTQMVKTDLNGKVLKQIPAANHHGDLCHHNGRVYVAVNLGRFNQPAGTADSWVFEYDADTLKELGRYPVQEVVHGAGGIEFQGGKFFVVGGLPPGIDENYAYEYNEKFEFQKRHVIKSGYSLMGIQTVLFHNGSWWFGCYGKPAELIQADANFEFTGRQNFDCALGLIGLEANKLLIARDPRKKGEQCRGRLVPAVVSADGKITLVDEPKTDAAK